MKFAYYLFCFAFGISYVLGKNTDSGTLPRRTYQDIVINNQVVQKGYGQACASRYEAIRPLLNLYKRPFTVLDIGAAEGYFSFKIAHDYDATCVMINDPYYQNNLLQTLCWCNNTLDTIILLSQRVGPHHLKRLSECEHFDVVLALSVIHNFDKNNWQAAAEAIMNLGDFIIIETPPAEDKGACGQGYLKDIEKFIAEHGGIPIAQTPRHTAPNQLATTYCVRGKNTQLKRGYWIGDLRENQYKIKSTFTNKTLTRKHKNKVNASTWHKGINLVTFKCLRGTYPVVNDIKKAVAQLQNQPSNDWFLHNMIIQGKSVVLIDTDDIRNQKTNYSKERVSDKLLSNSLHLLDIKEPAQFSEQFWKCALEYYSK